MKTCPADRAAFVAWLQDATSDRMSIRAWAVGEDMADDCDQLEAENLRLFESWASDRAKIAALTKERDHLRTCLGYWEGQHFERVVRERDENEEIARTALAIGDHLAWELESYTNETARGRAVDAAIRSACRPDRRD